METNGSGLQLHGVWRFIHRQRTSMELIGYPYRLCGLQFRYCDCNIFRDCDDVLRRGRRVPSRPRFHVLTDPSPNNPEYSLDGKHRAASQLGAICRGTNSRSFQSSLALNIALRDDRHADPLVGRLVSHVDRDVDSSRQY